MKKNVAGQIVGCMLIAKTDGTPVTTGVTDVYITGDNGSQGQGNSPGAATHKGNGTWTYVAAQSETNYDHVIFTFVNSSAVNAQVQIYTTFPQTGDNFARLGAPAGASHAADVAAVKVDTAAIKTKTDSLTFSVAGVVDSNVTQWKGSTAAAMTGDAYARLGAPAGASVSADVAAVNAKTTNLPASPAAVGSAMTLTSAYDFAKGNVAMSEDYVAAGSVPNPIQAICAIHNMLANRSRSGTTLSIKKFDATTVAMTFTLDSSGVATSQVRAT